jgi:hypothetical protein
MTSARTASTALILGLTCLACAGNPLPDGGYTQADVIEVARLGEPLYSYQPPTGYPDRNEAWMNSGTLLSRLNFGPQLASGKLVGVKVDLAALNPPQSPRPPQSWQEAMNVYPPLLLSEGTGNRRPLS